MNQYSASGFVHGTHHNPEDGIITVSMKNPEEVLKAEFTEHLRKHACECGSDGCNRSSRGIVVVTRKTGVRRSYNPACFIARQTPEGFNDLDW